MVNNTEHKNMATTPLLDKVLGLAKAKGFDRDAALLEIASVTDRKGNYAAAKRWGVLVNNSAEDFMIQFMGTFNSEIYYRY